ncbi:TniQ family protein [Teredinibacter turnerae]|uniref:TniQ family protein n=1 Tax=Teredinibacter turnerae TaxID=2426 RepID=UPI0003752B53|nr:TniQ family protein [Teredinibacter turnerae]
MKIDLKSLQPSTTGAIEHSSDSYPYFLPVPAYGQNSGDIEALSSYICRQAEMVGEWAHSYTTRLLEEYLQDEDLPKDRHIPSQGTHAYNSIGVAETRLSKAVSLASQGRVNPNLMTLRCIENLTDLRKHGLMRDHIAWCNLCWTQDMESGRRPYLRLYWTLQQSKICTKHNVYFNTTCPNCDSTNQQFPNFPRQWICGKCGHSLFEGKQNMRQEKISDSDLWFSNAVHRLLEAINRDGFTIDEHTIPKAFRRVIETTNLAVFDLSRELQIRHRRLKEIIEGKKRPYFAAFMDLCYRMDIPPHELLFSTCNLTSPENWKTFGKTSFTNMSKLTAQKKAAIKKALEEAIRSNQSPPPQVSKIAMEFGIQYTTIQQNFETEYKELVKRRITWERQLRKTRHQHRIESLCEGIFKLARSGKFPSERNIRKIEAAKPHELRRYDLSLILSAFQQVYTNQGLIDEETIE